MPIHKFKISDGDPNTDTSKVNITQPAANTFSKMPTAADLAAQQQRNYAAYQAQNATMLEHLQEREVRRRREVRLHRALRRNEEGLRHYYEGLRRRDEELRRRNLTHKDIYG